MNRIARVLAALLLAASAPVFAQSTSASSNPALGTSPSAQGLNGTYLFASLPPASRYTGYIAYT